MLLRISTLLSFLILAAPMYQACSDSTILSLNKKQIANPEMDNSSKDSLKLNSEEQSIYDRELEKDKNKFTMNGYQIVKAFFVQEGKFQLSLPDDKISWALFLFIPFTLFSLVLFIFFFFKQMEWISIVNLFLVLISYFLLLFWSDDYRQIKYGFYLLILNSFLIAIFSSKEYLFFRNKA